jgi:phage terminase small subunit
MKVLTEADGLVLANLCIVHSHLILQLAKMREFNTQSKSGLAGMVIQTKSGYLALNQLYANVQGCMDQELKLCRELGLTPSARSRMNNTEKPKGEADAGDTLDGNWAAQVN